MPSHTASTASFRKILRLFRCNRRGSAAVEFAMVAPVFFALLFAIIETAIVFLAGEVLEMMMENSARMIVTGQAQLQSYSQQDFQNYVQTVVCKQIPVLFSCTNIYVDVQSYPAFSTVTINSQIDPSGQFIDNMQYKPGGACDIVVVRLFYQWQLIVTGLGYNISNLAGNKRLLSATAAFKNEPYAGSAC